MRQSGQTAAKGRGIKKLLSLVLVTAMVFSCGISSAFAAGTSGVQDTGAVTEDITLKFGRSEHSKVYKDGDSLANSSFDISYNSSGADLTCPAYITSSAKVTEAKLSDGTNLITKIKSSSKGADGKYTSVVDITTKFAPSTKTPDDEFDSNLTIVLENKEEATFKDFTILITNTPMINAIFADGKDIGLIGNLTIGKTYSIKTEVVDKGNVIAGREFLIHWEIYTGTDFAEIKDTGKLSTELKVKAAGEFDLSAYGEAVKNGDDFFIEGSMYVLTAGGSSNPNPPTTNDKPSSSGGGGSSAKTGVTMTDKIASAQNAAAGDTVSLNVSKGDIIPATLLDAITGKDVNLTISYDGKTYTVNGKALKPAAGIVIYYTPEELIAALGASATTTATAATGKGYAVKANDSLWDIAQRALGNGARFPEIIAANKLKTNFLKVGQTLIMPAK